MVNLCVGHFLPMRLQKLVNKKFDFNLYPKQQEKNLYRNTWDDF